jgi:hypothetical protein
MRLSDVLAGRLRAVRLDLYGEHGGPLLAEALGIPTRSWVLVESGVAPPGLVLLRFLEVAGVESHWLLTGEGRRYRVGSRGVHGPRREPGTGSGGDASITAGRFRISDPVGRGIVPAAATMDRAESAGG